ncbi:hypothetical protein [Halorubrum sp. PV6]|uniref:hypothetical protein n=1 Tax=Halorubrum sp. PV6 TaxID=634157 RepID=UPI001304FED2|nr:hypothetical protein [Halorubrum sp. PV6]
MFGAFVEDGAASMMSSAELAVQLGSSAANQFDREWFFKSDLVTNILNELEQIYDSHSE